MHIILVLPMLLFLKALSIMVYRCTLFTWEVGRRATFMLQQSTRAFWKPPSEGISVITFKSLMLIFLYQSLIIYLNIFERFSKRAAEAWLYSYTRSFNGFVAKLTEDEKEKISS